MIYCATGEANISPDCYPGNGLYISRDGGGTWELRATAETHNLPRRVGVLLPTAPQCCIWAGVTLDEIHPAGLYAFAGRWQDLAARELVHRAAITTCHSLVAHPDGFLLAGLDLGGAQTGIWRGGDDGAWRQLHGGLPPGDKTGRISLAMSPSRPDTVYALVANRLGSEVLGVYRSRNGGERWQEVGGIAFRRRRAELLQQHDRGASRRSRYRGLRAQRHPHQPRRRRHVAARQPVGRADRRSAIRALRSARHRLPGGDRIYAANDGGVVVSEDLGRNLETCACAGWSTRCSTTSTWRPTNGRIFGGGAQDNGTPVDRRERQGGRVSARAGRRRRVDGVRPRGREPRMWARAPTYTSSGTPRRSTGARSSGKRSARRT